MNSKLKTQSQRSETTNSNLRPLGGPELQLIQAALRVDADRDAALAAALRRPLDWNTLQRLAQYHRVLPLVFPRLKEVAPDLVPIEAIQQMTAWQKAHELRVFRMTADLIKITCMLEANGIPVLSLKGPTLATLAYGNPASRSFNDLDILVREEDIYRAITIFKSLSIYPMSELSESNIVQGREHQFYIPNREYILELHWRLATPEFPHALVEIDCLFNRNRMVIVNGHSLMTLSANDMIPYLCHHGTTHRWKQFKHFTDFMIALNAIDMNEWDSVLRVADMQGLGHAFLTGVYLLENILGMMLPESIKRSIHHNHFVWLAVHNVVLAHISLSELKDPDRYMTFKFFQYISHNARINFLKRPFVLMFKPTINDFNYICLKPCFHWLYPFVRLCRLSGLAVKTFMMRIGKCRIQTRFKRCRHSW